MKMNFALAAVFATLTAGVAATAHADHAADFKIHNGAGFPIVSLFISDASDDKWGEDILGKDVLNDGESTKITFTGDAAACKFDIKLEEKGGKTWVVPGINLCEVNDLVFLKDGDKVVYHKE